MRNRKQLAAVMAALLTVSTSGMVTFAGEKSYSIDMTDNNDEAWANVAMANDDTVTSGVNIRSSASEQSAVVGYLYRGGAVTVLDKGDAWSEVTSGGVTGYIRNEYLVYGAEAKGLAEHYGSYGVRASWNDVNVFAGNDAASKVVGQAEDGDTFLQIGSDGHWIEVQRGADSTAFVSAEDVHSVIMVGSAVAVNGSADESSQTAAYSEPVYTEETYTDSSYTDTTDYSDTTDADTQYSDNTYTESYTDETAYTDTYTEDTASYADTYTEPVYTENTYTDSTYTAPSTDGMDLATKAQTLYQAYVEAQNAADAAVANGEGEDAIISTANAAQQAYAVYVEAQNAADAASWGVSAETAPTQTDSYTAQTQAPVEEPAAEVQPETQAPETEAAASVSSSDLDLLAALIYCEAGNQPYDGQVAVGAVVMNRIASGSFPNTINDVIYASGQFTPAYSGALASALASGAGAGYIGAAQAAMAGQDPTGGCLYFNTSHGSGVRIGAHWFY